MKINRINEAVWEIPISEKQGMNVPARIIATEKLLGEMDTGVFEQVTNLACLPGIIQYALAMPDAHWGYGSPIGGVAAFDLEKGIISPGLIGFDINCGMRLCTTNLSLKEVQPKLKELINVFFKTVPAGVGAKGFMKMNKNQFEEVMKLGSKWCIENGFGWKQDLERIEENGCIKQANPLNVSEKAIERGLNQLGTLGSGNHYLEVQVAKAENIFDEKTAKQFGIIEKNQIVIMLHCGSRGFGHQIATDYMQSFMPKLKEWNIELKDKELVCAPFQSPDGQKYFSAMACAANMAFANRQIILHRIREGFEKVFSKSAEEMELELVYDVAHNIAKIEEYKIDGKKRKLIVHRKGATRSLGPNNPLLSERFQKTGQPVIIGGSMETGSYLLVGTKKAEEETFGSSCHGSGRTMSRTKAKKEISGEELQKKLLEKGIFVKSVSMNGLAEEAGFAYKNISEVIEAVEKAGISRKIVGLKPIGNVKG